MGKQGVIDTDARHALLAERAALAADVERKIRPGPLTDDLGALGARARLAMRQIEGRVAGDLSIARARAVAARADVDRFRESRGLERGALYPESKLLSTGLLVVLCAVEAMASAPIFADALKGGLAQGYMMAVTLSGLNAGIGFFGGYLGLRYMTQKRAASFWLGLVGFSVALFVGLFLNIFSALWRARSVEAMERAALLAKKKASAVDLAMTERGTLELLFDPYHGETVVLMILGAIVLTAAFHKGFSAVDDPTPDYGKLDRAARAAEEHFEDLAAEARESLEESIDEVRDGVADGLEQRRVDLAAARSAFDAAAESIAQIDARLRATGEIDPLPDALSAAGAKLAAAEAVFAAYEKRAENELAMLVVVLDETTQRLAGTAR